LSESERDKYRAGFVGRRSPEIDKLLLSKGYIPHKEDGVKTLEEAIAFSQNFEWKITMRQERISYGCGHSKEVQCNPEEQSERWIRLKKRYIEKLCPDCNRKKKNLSK
jgi:hypothetical protein